MKKILILLLFILCGFLSRSQAIKQKHVPSIIVNAFQLKYPKASHVEWELEKGFYKVEFKIGETDCETWLDYMGMIKKQRRDMEAHELPKAIKITIGKLFDGFDIHNVERIEEGKSVVYKMKLEKGTEDRRVTFNQQGKILQNKLR